MRTQYRRYVCVCTLSVLGTFFIQVLSQSPMYTTDGCHALATYTHTHTHTHAHRGGVQCTVTIELTLKTMCSSILRPALPGYLRAMLPGVRSNMCAPASVHMLCTSIFLPTPLGPAIMTDLMWGAFSWTAWDPAMMPLYNCIASFFSEVMSQVLFIFVYSWMHTQPMYPKLSGCSKQTKTYIAEAFRNLAIIK